MCHALIETQKNTHERGRPVPARANSFTLIAGILLNLLLLVVELDLADEGDEP